ncbi:hypothetical protein Ahy_B06g079886 [Arachis hypogaea]|uniref:Aminotransferase-like plant mobile domain-containing protein n=1 Tax=Arachis hypogaea TaxID=3818 RepID=A0A444YGJ1_ARAHY|nr:hypothetical protein Ahy_B06g079886 [Arachis hypogaea]
MIQFSWRSAYLAHLYRVLCRASRVDCKKIDGPLTLLFTWAWIRLPFLAPIPDNLRLLLIINRWRNWERANWPYRFHSLAYFRRSLDNLQERQAYGVDRIEADVIPVDIRQHSIIWSAMVPLISFECVEWHACNRMEWDLGEAHGEVPTGPKNQDWSVTFWVMQWTNRYNHVLAEPMVPSRHPLKIYMYWYRSTYGTHLHLSDIQPPPSPSPPPPPHSQTQAQQDPEHFTPYIPHTHFTDYFTPLVHYINNIGVFHNLTQGIKLRLPAA